MTMYYAIFYPLEKSKGWGVKFPDAPSINTSGKDVDEAIEMATDALSGMLVCGRKGKEYQNPQNYEIIKGEAQQGELVFPIKPDAKIMEEYRPKKRINIMIPMELLEKVGDFLKDQKGLDRSKFICNAIEKQLNI